jgi:hypothetical protein
MEKIIIETDKDINNCFTVRQGVKFNTKIFFFHVVCILFF